jgi:hypothetical protein
MDSCEYLTELLYGRDVLMKQSARQDSDRRGLMLPYVGRSMSEGSSRTSQELLRRGIPRVAP